MAIIGILFDIDALGGGFYGKAAYEILFHGVEHDNIRGVKLYDGDTAATLSGANNSARLYCIAVESDDEGVIRHIEEQLTSSTRPGLCPPKQRFLRGTAAIKAEPLVFAGAIDAHGILVGCETPWIISAWPGQAKTVYDVALMDVGSNKLAVIKEVQNAIGPIGLAAVKALVEGAPITIKASINKTEAMDVMRKLEAAGAKVEIR